MLRETQWPAAEWREACSQNHSVIRVLWRLDHFLFQATRGFINHEKDEAMRQFALIQPQPWIAMPIRRNDRAFGAFRVAMQSPPPLRQRVVS